MKVLIDARVRGADGIGRYTNLLVKSMRDLAQHKAGLEILTIDGPGNTRYTSIEGGDALFLARRYEVDLVHLLDYRVPVEEFGCPVLLTIHDLMRLTLRQHCYSDQQFSGKFGPDRFQALELLTARLRELQADDKHLAEPSWRSLHEEFYTRMLSVAVSRADAIVTLSDTVRHQVVTRLKPAVPVVAIKPGIDHLPPPVLWPRKSSYRPSLLYVGQARSHKGLEALIDVLRHLDEHQLRSCLLVGRDFSPDGRFANELKNARVLHRCVLAGEVSDLELSEMYTSASVLLHLSEHEGFGFTPLEALASGTNVIVNDLPIFRETLGRFGNFVDSLETARVADVVLRLVQENRKVDDQACRRWLAQYKWVEHAEEVYSIYSQLI